MGFSRSQLLRATFVQIIVIQLVFFRTSFSDAEVDTITPAVSFNHTAGQDFSAQCSIEVSEEDLEHIIDSDGHLQLGVRMLDCEKRFFVPDTRTSISEAQLTRCTNIPAQNVTCARIQCPWERDGLYCRHYRLTWVVIPGDYLSAGKNYSFACHEINNSDKPDNCPSHAFHISVTAAQNADSSPRSSRAPSSVSPTTATERIMTPGKVKDHSTSGIKTVTKMGNMQEAAEQTDTSLHEVVVGPKGSIGNGASRNILNPIKVYELVLYLVLVELLTRR